MSRLDLLLDVQRSTHSAPILIVYLATTIDFLSAIIHRLFKVNIGISMRFLYRYGECESSPKRSAVTALLVAVGPRKKKEIAKSCLAKDPQRKNK